MKTKNKNIVIVESPSKAKTINGYLGSGYKVIGSVGHVRDLPKSKLGIDIESKFNPQYINIRGKGDLINELKKEAKNADNIYLATDPDREGEAIAWHLATVLGIDAADAKRVTFNEITKTAVKSGIKTPKKIDMNLVDAQQARRIIDRLVGYQISPFLWKNVKNGLSAGRVQSVATRIIVEREEEIRAFKPEEYWTILAYLHNSKNKRFEAKFFGDLKGKIELGDSESAENILKNLENAEYFVKSLKKSVRMRNPAAPFITSTLQQEANKKFNFPSGKTMRAAQELYEGVNTGPKSGTQGLITYMRTDSLRISDEARDGAKSYITDKYGELYYPEKAREYKSKKGAQDAHEAIRPTHISRDFEPENIKKSLSADQYKIYKLIWDRFISSQMQSAQLDTVSADIQAGNYIFKASGYSVKFPGFLAVYEETPDETAKKEDDHEHIGETKLPELSEGEKLNLNKLGHTQHFTQPPFRYTEASLIKALEEQGIGRPSTYAPTLTTISQRGYVEHEGKALKPTPLGEITNKVMIENFEDIVNCGFTARMEDDFDEIESGKIAYVEILEKFYGGFKRSLDEAEINIGKEEIIVPDVEIDYDCELCGKKLIVKNGRFGKFAACPNYPECKFTVKLGRDGSIIKKEEQPQPQKTDLKCELCGSEIVIRQGRYGNFYACSNYPKCKHTKPIDAETGAICPDCGGKILKKRIKNRGYFYGCEKYPGCKFSIWDTPLEKKCPECSGMLLQKKGGDTIYCYNKDCVYQEKAEPKLEK
ncbi:MAG: type I DNA topoisomerase [Oscillospiraceae bacterium]|nr:type I DNA topoisomerase [Oscillospiraceae bacterium]